MKSIALASLVALLSSVSAFAENSEADADRVMFSAAICASNQRIAIAREEIKDLKEESKEGGVVNLTAISEQQHEIRLAKKDGDLARKMLAKHKQKQMACDEYMVDHVASCRFLEAPQYQCTDTHEYERIWDSLVGIE